MSSKKARRRKLQEQARDTGRKKLSPVTVFILGIGLALVLTVVGALFFGVGGTPPGSGAVWSAEHGHWH